jgi:hypothetical protein
MAEWWTYSPSDFLLFSSRTYWRLFELHNEAVWPLHVAALLIGAGMLTQVIRPHPWSDKAISVGLGGIWIWIAFGFLWTRYSTINWAVIYAVPAFVAQGLLLVWIGGIRGRLHYRTGKSLSALLGLVLFAYAVILHPFIAILSGRPLAAAEVFGIAPDPTAVASLGLLTMTSVRPAAWLALLVPLAWCIASSITLVTMEAWEGWIPLTAVGLSIAARVRPPRTSVGP